jgi:hypothetical protein
MMPTRRNHAASVVILTALAASGLRLLIIDNLATLALPSAINLAFGLAVFLRHGASTLTATCTYLLGSKGLDLR